MLRQNKGGHGIGQSLDDPRNEEQQRPQNNIEVAQEPLGKTGTEPVKLGEQIPEFPLFSVLHLQQEPGISQLQGAAQEKRRQPKDPTPESEGEFSDPQAFLQPFLKEIEQIPDPGNKYRNLHGDLRQKAAAHQQATQQLSHSGHSDGNGPVALQRIPRPCT